MSRKAEWKAMTAARWDLAVWTADWKATKGACWGLVERRKAELLVAKSTDGSSTEYG